MVCIYCSDETHVTNSRPQRRSNQVWRRRQCLSCKAIFSTEEAANYTAAWSIRAASGTIEPFSRDKLFLSLYKSCQHRKSAVADARALTDTITSKLLPQVRNGSLGDKTITQTALVALSRFDKAAATHYQAFHKL